MKTTKTQNKPARSKPLWRQAAAFLALLLLAAGAAAQVTIGAGTPPQPFSIMEIISNQKRGLRMAHLTTDQRNSITTSAFKANAEAKGLTIYNTTTNCMEFWSGSKWISTCQGEPFSIPATEGDGTFTGKVCFDLAQGNDATGYCAPLTSRTAKKADFSLTTEQDPAIQTGTTPYTGNATPYSGVQVYTFTPPAAVSNVRFGYVDPSGKVVAGMEPKADYSGNNISTACKVAVTYKPTLNDDLKGRTTIYALKTDLYVVYNDAADGTGTDKYLKLDITLSDCACCGAMAIPFTGNQSQLQWQAFMCYNLGADQKLDPFTWKSDGRDVDNDIKGYLYQWGRQSDGHEKRTSYVITYPTPATNNQATAPAEVIGNFITTDSYTKDWRDGGEETSRWGNGTQNAIMPKSKNDPCPPGWKVPTPHQWASIFSGDGVTIGLISAAIANMWTWSDIGGCMVGENLYLPGADFRLCLQGDIFSSYNGYYWSSTVNGVQANNFRVMSNIIITKESNCRANAYSVRCVLE
ncbi:hypothetical protein D0T84_17745 [Dysgonomonas sp. 521]|uniref:FISUMP domain-containing protein n=1 Tax=Dysgonomonas sp. 521 TaxID=2302932 RepID=UPI0013D6C326|nr:FISUMP domain-containing protein [Dysgonomonas sp. 521]NDV96739.1 hypothetical protein [Dysgonomonas sp. 521]